MMQQVVLLDSGPYGMYANPQGGSPKTVECKKRVDELLASGIEVRVPGISEYETRRKLEHLTRKEPNCKAIDRLNLVLKTLGLLPITNEVMMKAAEIWGLARSKGIVTADPEALDGDVILAAHVQIELAKGIDVEVATTNSGDLTLLGVKVLDWDDLKK